MAATRRITQADFLLPRSKTKSCSRAFWPGLMQIGTVSLLSRHIRATQLRVTPRGTRPQVHQQRAHGGRPPGRDDGVDDQAEEDPGPHVGIGGGVPGVLAEEDGEDGEPPEARRRKGRQRAGEKGGGEVVGGAGVEGLALARQRQGEAADRGAQDQAEEDHFPHCGFVLPSPAPMRRAAATGARPAGYAGR